MPARRGHTPYLEDRLQEEQDLSVTPVFGTSCWSGSSSLSVLAPIWRYVHLGNHTGSLVKSLTQSKAVESRGVYIYSTGVPQPGFVPLAYIRCLKQFGVSGCGSYHPLLSGSQHSFERNSSSVCILQALSWTEANWDARAEFWKSSSCVLHLGWQVTSQSIMPF